MKTANQHDEPTRASDGPDARGEPWRCPLCGDRVRLMYIDGCRWVYCDPDQIRWRVPLKRTADSEKAEVERRRAVTQHVTRFEIVDVAVRDDSIDVPDTDPGPSRTDRCWRQITRGHVFLPEEARQRLPKLYSTETVKDAVVQVKFLSPWNGWAWYVTEFDGDDVFFGLVDGFFPEWGYFRLSELEAATHGSDAPAVERDVHFKPAPVSKLTLRSHGRD